MKNIFHLLIGCVIILSAFASGLKAQVIPVVYYKFDATGTATDTLVTDVFGNYHAVKQLNYTWVPDGGKFSGALRFSGNTEVDLAPVDVNHIFNAGYREKTVAMWIKANNPSENGMIYYDGPGNSNMGLRLLQGTLQGVVNSGDNTASPTFKVVSTPFNKTDWTHVALVFDHGDINLFIDGELAATDVLGVDTVIRTQRPAARLGYKTSGWTPFRTADIGATAVYNFSGLIDDFMLFAKSLKESDIQFIMEGDTATIRPAAPTDLTAEALSNNRININWQVNSDNERGFVILAGTSGDDFNVVGQVPPGATTFSHTRLQSETTYYYRVYALNFVGNSDTTEVTSVTTLEAPLFPDAPENLVATVNDFKHIDLSWDDRSDNEEGFRVAVSVNEQPFEVVADLPANTESFQHMNLYSKTQYAYIVFAYNAGGNSDSSNTVIVTTPPQPIVDGIAFPYDAGIINVKDYGVVGDGVTDDTEAIQEVLNKYPIGGIIYFPEGTYVISNTLEWITPYRSVTFQGQGKDKVTIRLKDNCEGFQNTVFTKAMIWTGLKPAQRFRNYLRDMTINTGSGNPGADGLQFYANNAGGIFDVEIISEDGNANIGLNMGYSDEQGPCLIKNVTIKGFNIGISANTVVNSITMENITLIGQKQYGLLNTGQVISIMNLNSDNEVTVISNQALTGLITVIKGNFTGGKETVPAISNNGTLYVRDLNVDGYKVAIQNQVGNQIQAMAPFVEDYISHPVITAFPTEEKALHLPVKETPVVQWDNDFDDWANVQHYGAVAGDGNDDTQAIQDAIDAGKTTVYFPKGEYHLNGTVEIRGNVRRIIGLESTVSIPTGSSPAFKLVDGVHEVVVFERFAHFGYNEHVTMDNASDRTLVIRNNSAFSGNFTGTGDVFIEDIVSNINSQLVFGSQNVWARQLNIESRNGMTHLVNNGGNVWVLGYKTEQKGIQIHNQNGGRLEVLGGLVYSVGTSYPGEMIVNENSDITVIIKETNFGTAFPEIVKDVRGSEEKILLKADFPQRGNGTLIPMFVSRASIMETLSEPTGLTAEKQSDSSVLLSWTASVSAPVYYIIERKPANGSFWSIATTDSDEVQFTDTDLDPNGEYHYRVRATDINELFSPYSNEVSIDINDTSVPRVNSDGVFVIFPNPASETLFFRNIERANVNISDLTGRIMISGYIEAGESLNISHISNGAYIVSISSGNKTITRKLIKN